MNNAYSEPLGDSFQYDPDYNRFADFLGIDLNDRRDMKTAQKISRLTDWALRHAKGRSVIDAMAQVHKLIKDKGLNVVGNTLLNNLYQDIRLKEDSQRLQDTREVEKRLAEKAVRKEEKKVQAEEKSANAAEEARRMQGEISRLRSESTQIEAAIAQAQITI